MNLDSACIPDQRYSDRGAAKSASAEPVRCDADRPVGIRKLTSHGVFRSERHNGDKRNDARDECEGSGSELSSTAAVTQAGRLGQQTRRTITHARIMPDPRALSPARSGSSALLPNAEVVL